MKKFRGTFQKYLKILNPIPPIGGLAVTDSTIRFFMLKGEQPPMAVSLRLPPGLIEKGVIKNADNFKAALKDLRAKISPGDKPIHVILTLPPELVYMQTFTIPIVDDKQINETANLNLQMISPINFQTAYSGWQKIGENFSDGGKLELLGAFVEASSVQQLAAVLEGENFIIAAVEFPALAVARLAARQPGMKAEESYLIIDVSADGLTLLILRNFNLHFNHFHSWKSIQDELGSVKISDTDFYNFAVQEIKKVLNFYSSRWGGSINGVMLANQSLGEALAKAIEANFSLKTSNLAVPEFPGLSAVWLAVLGSALRGTLPRHMDNFISLTDVSVQVRYRQARLLNFAGLWSKLILTTAGFLLAIFGAADIFLALEADNLQKRLAGSSVTPDLAQVTQLQSEVQIFNDAAALALQARNSTVAWSPLVAKLEALAGDQIVLKFYAIKRAGISLEGSGVNEQVVISFKDRLAVDKDFKKVELSLTDIKISQDGSIFFRLTLTPNLPD